MRMLLIKSVAILAVCAFVAAPPCRAAEAIHIDLLTRTTAVDFETEIAPLLRANCLACHQEKKAEANLVLETPQTILKGGDQGPAVVAGKGVESLLLKAAAHQDDVVMPPPENMVGAKSLTGAQLGLLKLWIDQGAVGSVKANRDVQWQPLPKTFQPAIANAVTPDGLYGVCSSGNRLAVYHLPSGKLAAMLADPGLNGTAGESPSGWAHRDIVRCLAFDPAGDRLASGSFREVKLWRRPRATRLAEWAHDSALATVAVSSDGRLAATGDEAGRIRIWEVAAAKTVHTIAAHQAAVTGLVFSPDGAELYSCGIDKSLRIWNTATGEPVGKPVETAAPISAIVAVNKGQWLATGHADGFVRIWEAKAVREAAGDPVKPLQEIKAHEVAIAALVSQSAEANEFLTGGADGLVRRWNAETGKQLAELKIDGPVAALAVRPDGRRIAAAGTNGVTLWSDDGKPVAQLNADPRLAAKVAQIDAQITFSKSAIALAHQDLKSYEGLIRISGVVQEDVKKAEEELVKAEKMRDEKKAALEKVKTENGKTEPAEKALAEAETAVAVAGTVIVRSKAIAERTLQERAAAEKAVAAREELLKQQEAAKEAAVGVVKGAPLKVRSVAFSTSGGRLAVGCEVGEIHFYDAESGVASESHVDHPAAVRALAFSSAGKLLAAFADQRAAVWNAPEKWDLERVIGGGQAPEAFIDRVLAVDFSRDGQWLATGGGLASRSGELKIWNVADGRLVREIPDAHNETVFAVRFSPDGKHLASAGGDRFVKVFEAQSGKTVHRLAGHTGYVLALGWNADGKLLASSGSDNVIKLWNAETGLSQRTMKGGTYGTRSFRSPVTSVSFIGESEELIATSGDGIVRLFRSTSDNEVMAFAGSKGYQFSAVATPDGRTILASGSDGILRIWTGHTPQLKQSFTP